MKLFNAVDLETSSFCNRLCKTCLRNMWPDRSAVLPLFKQNFMSEEMFRGILDQLVNLGYHEGICLCHWNEPLMDPRIVDLIKIVKSYNCFFVYLVTNGDYLTQDLSLKLDGLLDRIVISLYEDREQRKSIFRNMFKNTKVWIKGHHRIAHHNPNAISISDEPCKPRPRRLIITHQGQYLLCCEDLLGEFNFGYFPEVSIRNYWFGEKHRKILRDLEIPGGRYKYEYCKNCPMKY